MALPSYMFVSSCDGSLYDTRVEDWNKLSPLRSNYSCGKREISTVSDLKAALRNGEYAWPGGYQLYFVMGDGEAMSFESVRNNLREAFFGMHEFGEREWQVIGCEINYEDSDLRCAHSGERIPSAYAEDNDEDNDESAE